MQRIIVIALILVFLSILPRTASAGDIDLKVKDVEDGALMPEIYASCKKTADGKVVASLNKRPTISWHKPPFVTKSLAIFISDFDVPADLMKYNIAWKLIPKDIKANMHYHWALVDIPSVVSEIVGGGSTKVPEVGIQLIRNNGYSMGSLVNYMGPCPPSNDHRMHHYRIKLYALDIPSLGVSAKTTARAAEEAINSGHHILAEDEVIITYSLGDVTKN